jgi:hypothetical protein
MKLGWRFYLVFICITFVGGIVYYFILPETKGVPLEEIAKIFGETEEVMVFSEDMHWDHNTHELKIGTHGHPEAIEHVATLDDTSPANKDNVDKVEQKV